MRYSSWFAWGTHSVTSIPAICGSAKWGFVFIHSSHTRPFLNFPCFLYLNKVQRSQALQAASNSVVLIFCFLLKAGTYCCISTTTTYAFPVCTSQSRLSQLLIPRKLPLLILPGIEDICSQTGSNIVVACMFVKFVLFRFNLRQSDWMEVSATSGCAQMLFLRSPCLHLQILALVTCYSESMWYSLGEY